MIKTVGFVGAGSASSALASAVQRAGYRVTGIASRGTSATRLATALGVRRQTPERLATASDLVVLAVPDDAIEGIARSVRWPAGVLVAHVSGARSLDVLEPARLAGARVGSMHPMQSFAGSSSLDGVTFGIEGDADVQDELSAFAQRLGGEPLLLAPDQKALYHLAGTMTSNFLVALTWAAASLWQDAGLAASRQEALQRLLPLIRGTTENLSNRGLPGALTGPASRGDGGTVARHLTALAENGTPGLVDIYCRLTDIALEVARARGLDRQAALRVSRAMQEFMATSAGSPGRAENGVREPAAPTASFENMQDRRRPAEKAMEKGRT